jgi:hypothetical protein
MTPSAPEVIPVAVATLLPRWLSYEVAAPYSSISSKSLRRLVAAGKLQAHRPVKGKIVLDRLELDAYIAGATATPRTGRGRS